MEPAILARILEDAPGITRADDGRFAVDDEHRVTFYLGQPGQAMVVGDVAGISLGEGYVRLAKRDGGGEVFVAADDVHAVATKPPKAREERRTGFV